MPLFQKKLSVWALDFTVDQLNKKKGGGVFWLSRHSKQLIVCRRPCLLPEIRQFWCCIPPVLPIKATSQYVCVCVCALMFSYSGCSLKATLKGNKQFFSLLGSSQFQWCPTSKLIVIGFCCCHPHWLHQCQHQSTFKVLWWHCHCCWHNRTTLV